MTLSFFLFLLLDPLVEFLTRKTGLSRGISSFMLIILTVGFGALTLSGAYSASSRITQKIPRYSGKIKSALRTFEGKAESLQKGTKTFLPDESSQNSTARLEIVRLSSESWAPILLRGIDSLAGIIGIFLFVPLLVLFLLFDKVHLNAALNRISGRPQWIRGLGIEMRQMVRGFFFGNFLVAVAAIAVFFGIFSALGLENSLSLALMAGLINLIPILGAVIGALFPMAQAFLQFNTLGPTFLVLASSLFIHFLMNNVLIPKVVGSRINVNSSAAVVGLFFWAWLWGPVGLLLAVPLTAMIRIALSSRPATSPWADLLSKTSTALSLHPSLSKAREKS